MVYRTRTYIAGDWTGDRDLIDKLYQWNESNYWGLSFSDAHALTQARDSSLPCSIKRSLRERLDGSKTFVLIVGSDTENLTKGACRYCSSYSSYSGCRRGYSADQRSFIKYECDYAVEHDLKIVVLYNYSSTMKSKCPKTVRNVGEHMPAYYWGDDGGYHWYYYRIKEALES